MTLTILTPTGERPEAFALCQMQLARQTYAGPVRWVVIDDGEAPSSITLRRDNWTIEVIRPTPFWKPGENTQGRNLKAGLERVGADDVLTVWEDDDWYHPDWLKTVADRIWDAELIGERYARYYNVHRRKWSRLNNAEHASLRCSAMRGQAIEAFREVLQTPNRFYDLKLWTRHKNRALFDTKLTLGMKGLPGRPGIAEGHDGLRGKPDPDGSELRRMIGDDADWYLPFYEELRMSDRKMIVIKPFRYNRRDWARGEVFTPKFKIDGELHIHAKKVEWQTVKPAPVRQAKPVVKEMPKAPPPHQIEEPKAEDPAAEAKEDAKPAEKEKPRKGGKLSIGI